MDTKIKTIVDGDGYHITMRNPADTPSKPDIAGPGTPAQLAREAGTIMNDHWLAAFNEFNDAAYAIGHCQLAQATAAAERLEAARRVFHNLFMDAVKADAIAARGRA